MLDAIIGDIAGSIYEGNPIKAKNFPFFEDYCCFTVIVKFRINWALSNSLNTYNRHSDWKPKLKVYATNVSIYFRNK